MCNVKPDTDTRTGKLLGILVFALTASVVQPASAGNDVINGVPGSPSATVTISGEQIPAPPPKFEGSIERNAAQSKPYWPPRIEPHKGAPNVLLIITDDTGFGTPSTFGGVIPTPTLDRVARDGLRYTNFHSTALCSPTRAALLTGRNHHSVGFGVISEQSSGYPGYNSIISRDKATIGRMLKDNGYRTAWFGKDHNVPTFQASQDGPFDQWPIGMGFEYFYGFIGGDANQWAPNLFRNTTQIYPFVGKPGWNLTTAMADDAIDYVNRINAVAPDQPFFIKYAPGGVHAPHHPTPEWIEKISKMKLFDQGWNKLRDQIFENQKKLGVIPADAKLTPWPKDLLKDWDTLSPDEQKMFIRQVDVFAAYVAYTDHEIGRVIQAVEDMGKLDNTLVIYISGDNGGSAEGTLLGTPNEVASFNGVNVPVADQLKNFYDDWGSDKTYNHMSVAWSWAFDTPFSWTKQIASHFGGVRQGMAIMWPKVITDKGGIRNQFQHVIDVVPTILEATQVNQPKVVDGITQSPIEGVSMMYTFNKANADSPSNHKTQYFEMMGDHAIYHDGWIASSKVMRPPWIIVGNVSQDPAAFPWELYDLHKDWTQSEDVAAKFPEKLKEMQDIFWTEAQKYQVLPLDSTVATRLVTPRPSLTAGRNEFTWTTPLTGIPNGDAPSVLNTSYTFKAEVEVPAGGADGMLITQGGRFGGYGFYLLKNKPVFLWNLVDLKRQRWEGPELKPGKHVLEFDFKYDGLGMGTLAFNNMSGIGRGGTGVLKVDGEAVAEQKMERTIPLILQWDESLDIGSDTLTGVDDQDYQPPFAFTGKIEKITLTVSRPKLTPEDEQKLLQAQRDNKTSE
ncbi:arylsulfatase [Pseudomonas arsenicoxydans]|uniref:Arylsulfatase n=1 Tax=Pseudomonas arsenicoxydans TaxID=702115 RepID=A0A502HWW7_9PSED|nr:arylsulfatase [Pseudomonas arsenicoxydans]TPG78224.1 arylsulfatase [Pseudomonas arsenicoxydans]